LILQIIEDRFDYHIAIPYVKKRAVFRAICAIVRDYVERFFFALKSIKLIRILLPSISVVFGYLFFPEKRKFYKIISRYKPKFVSRVFKII
jgi:hypothetical protein